MIVCRMSAPMVEHVWMVSMGKGSIIYNDNNDRISENSVEKSYN